MPKTSHKPKAANSVEHPAAPADRNDALVLTLAEAAAYLRVSESALSRLADRGEVPGRKIDKDWRFFKPALQHWLGTAPKKRGLLSQIGAIKDDPYLEEMLREIYQRRGRSDTGEG